MKRVIYIGIGPHEVGNQYGVWRRGEAQEVSDDVALALCESSLFAIEGEDGQPDTQWAVSTDGGASWSDLAPVPEPVVTPATEAAEAPAPAQE